MNRRPTPDILADAQPQQDAVTLAVGPIEQPSNPLARLSAASRALAEAKTLDEVKSIRDLAQAAQVYARAAKMGLEAQNHAAEIKLRAERKAGELLKELEREQGGSGRFGSSNNGQTVSEYRAVLDETGTTRQDANRWETIAALPEPVFEQHIEHVKMAGQELTTTGVLRVAKQPAMAAHYSSDSPEWYTPGNILERVVRLFGRIDLDPCSNVGKPNVPAAKHYTWADDGLQQPWAGRVYMNPPYGREIDDWVQKLAEEYEAGNVIEAVALVPARTDTAWFRRLRQYVRCFIFGRLSFSDSGTAPFPSVAVYLGDHVEGFVATFGDIGDVYQVIEP